MLNSKYDKLDRIVVSVEDMDKITKWVVENKEKHDVPDGFPLNEGMIVAKMKDLEQYTYFKCDEDGMFIESADSATHEVTLSFNVHPAEYKETGILFSNVKVNPKVKLLMSEEMIDNSIKATVLMILDLFFYMTNAPANVNHSREKKIVAKKIRDKRSKGKNAAKTRYVKIGYNSYSFDFSSSDEKRHYDRHTPAWTVKGHWRNYKTGKKVWIESRKVVVKEGEMTPKNYTL